MKSTFEKLNVETLKDTKGGTIAFCPRIPRGPFPNPRLPGTLCWPRF